MQSVPLDKPKLSNKAQVTSKKCLNLLWTLWPKRNKYLPHYTTTLLPVDITCLSSANYEKSLQTYEQVNFVKVCIAKKFRIAMKINHVAYIKQLSLHTFRGQITLADGNYNTP
jgi:hypothetical protein